MPKNSSVIFGIHTGRSQTRKVDGDPRRTEDDVIKREERKKAAGRGGLENIPLCISHILPEGKACNARVERAGLYFCDGGKEGCPLEI